MPDLWTHVQFYTRQIIIIGEMSSMEQKTIGAAKQEQYELEHELTQW